MNARDVAELVSIVRTLYPAQRFDENPQNVMHAWALVVGDLQLDEARAAVVRLSRRGLQWCAPGDVRREVAAARNVLTPDVDSLLLDMRLVASRQGVGRKALHPAARHVYDAHGGAEAIKRMDANGLARLRRALDDARTKYDEHQLQLDELPHARLPYAQLTEHTLLALEAGNAPEQQPQRGTPMPEHVREQLSKIGELP